MEGNGDHGFEVDRTSVLERGAEEPARERLGGILIEPRIKAFGDRDVADAAIGANGGRENRRCLARHLE